MLLVATALILIGTISKSWVSAGERDERVHAGPMGVEICEGSQCIDAPFRGIDKDIEIIATLAMLSGFAAAAVAGVFGGMVMAGSKQVPFPTGLANTVFVIALLGAVVFLGRMLAEKMTISWAGFVAMGGVVVGVVGLKSVSPFLVRRAALPPGSAHPQQGAQPYQQGNPYGNQSQPMQPYANQSQPMQPYASQSQPMHPQQGSHPYAMPQQPQHGSQPYQMQPQGQHGSQPYQQPMQAQPQYGSQPHQAPQQQVPSCPRCGTQLQFVAQYQRWFCPREQQYV
jgi:hypothetical protein